MISFLQCRRRAGLSVDAVRELLKLSVETIRDYESGARLPTAREIQILRGLALSRLSNGANDSDPNVSVMESATFPTASCNLGHRKTLATMADLREGGIEADLSTVEAACPTASRVLTFYEFFAGGGMARAGLGSQWHCLFANEFDHKKSKVYRANWNSAPELKVEDVRKLTVADLPGDAALAWASFPCQDLSLAGAGAGLRGERSGTFWPFWILMTSLLHDGRSPQLIVLENVCGALASHRGQDFAAIADALANAGYHFGAVVIDAVDFVPQSRPRLFIVSSRDVPPKELTAPQPGRYHPSMLVAAYGCLSRKAKERWVWWHLPNAPKRNTSFADLIEDKPVGVKWHTKTQTAAILTMMSPINREKVRLAKKAGMRMVGGVYKRTRPDETGKKVQRAEVRFDGISGCLRTPVGGSSRQTILIIEGENVQSRLLSPRETARLMGLADDYILPQNYNEAYHLSGDGVVVPVVRFLAQHILEPLLIPESDRRRHEAA